MRFLRTPWLGPLLGWITLLMVLGFTPALWLRLEGWVQNQRDQVWEQWETLVGQKVVYDRIGPHVLAALDFQNVRLLSDDGTPVLTAASIRLSLDWWLILQGRISESLKRVQIINAVVNLDTRRDQVLLDHWLALARTPASAAAAAPLAFEVEAFNLNARWTDGVRSWSLQRGFALLSPDGKEWDLRFRGAVAWRSDEKGRSFAQLSVRGDLRSDAAFETWNLRTEASQVKTSWFDLEPVTLQVAFSPQEMTITKVADRIPLDLQVVWDRPADRWTFRGAAEEFRPSSWIRIQNHPAGAAWSKGTVTGRFSYQLGGDFSFAGSGFWPQGTLPPPFEAGDVLARGSVYSEGNLYHFQGFHFEALPGVLDFSGTLDVAAGIPEGTLVVGRWALPDAGVARGTLTLSRDGGRIVLRGQDVGWNDLTTTLIEGWVEPAGPIWNFQFEGPLDGTETGRFAVSGLFEPRVPRFEVSLSVGGIPLGILRNEIRLHASGFELPAALRALTLGAQGRLEGDPSGLTLSGTTFQFLDPERPERTGRGTVAYQDRRVEVELQAIEWDGIKAGTKLTADFRVDGTIDLAARGTFWDREFTLDGRWTPLDRTLVFTGTPGIRGLVHQVEGGWTVEAGLEPYEIAPGWTLGFQGRAAIDRERWMLEADQIDATGRYPWSQESFRVRTRLTGSTDFLRFEDLSLEDSHGRLVGTAISTWSPDFERPWAGRLTLATPESARESVTVDWVGTALRRWHLNAQTSGVDVSRAGPWDLQGRLALISTLDWDDRDGTWSAQASLSEARWGDAPLAFRASLSGTSRQVRVRNWNVAVNPLRISDGSIDLDVDGRSWRASAGVGLRLGAAEWASTWTGEGSWTGQELPFESKFRWATRRNTWGEQTLPDSAFSGSWRADGWDGAMEDGGIVARGRQDGTFFVRAQAPFPIRGEADGTWKGDRFSAAVQGFQADLGLVKNLVNSPFFSINAGEALGDFTVSGSLADPEVNGQLMLKGIIIESSFLQKPAGPIDAPVILEGHRVRIDPVNLAPDGQSWMVSGAARLDHLLPEEYQFIVQTDALSVIPASYRYTGLAATGNVSGLFIIRGSPLAVTLGGRLVLQDTTITLRNSPEFTDARDQPLGFNADLTLVTGRKVEFLWPNESLPLLRAVTTSNQTLTIKANDVASTWSVVGKLGLKTGEINYLNRTFVLKEGQLVFQENQESFDPRIAVRAEWRVRETTGTVTVNLRAEGTLSRFSPRFDAVPYKSPDELQRLVGTTLALPTDYTHETSMETALSLATDVGTSFLLTPFEETVKRNFNLDLFTVKTEVLKKSLINRNGTLEASDYLDNTRLFFGKYIGDDLFLQGTLAFRREDSATTQVSPKMVVEPELQMEFQTPLFLLNWTLLPQHPETLFVTDNTVTFRWSWSY